LSVGAAPSSGAGGSSSAGRRSSAATFGPGPASVGPTSTAVGTTAVTAAGNGAAGRVAAARALPESLRPPGERASSKVWTRYLRRLVGGLRGCLAAVPPRARKLLVWRTGIGGGATFSQRQVAHMLHTSLGRERRLERRAAVTLQRTASAGGCGGPVLGSSAMAIPAALLAGVNRTLEPITEGVVAGSSWGGNVPAATGSARRRAPHLAPGAPISAGVQPPSVASGGLLSVPDQGSDSNVFIWLGLALIAALAVVAPVGRRRALRGHSAPARALGGAGVVAGAGALAGALAPPRDADSDFQLAGELAQAGDTAAALAAYRRADAMGHPAAASNLGVLLEQRGDLAGALAAYRRADQRGDASGAFNLGGLLVQRGDPSGALAAYRRADERGDPAAAANLGALLEQQGDLDGALHAYRAADRRSDPQGAFNLGNLLARRGDLQGASEAYRRAAERGDRRLAGKALSALSELRTPR
jgi:hypothetical protein